MDKLQLPNALLYTVSTCAQVWAALLIFFVLFLRDIEKSLGEKKQDYWDYVNQQIEHFRYNLIVKFQNMGSRFEPYKIELDTLKNAPTEWSSFERFLEVLVSTPIIVQEGKMLGVTDPKALYDRIKSVKKKINTITERKISPKAGFGIGMVAIALDIAILGLHPILCSSWRLSGWSLLVITLINLALGYYMYRSIKGFIS